LGKGSKEEGHATTKCRRASVPQHRKETTGQRGEVELGRPVLMENSPNSSGDAAGFFIGTMREGREIDREQDFGERIG